MIVDKTLENEPIVKFQESVICGWVISGSSVIESEVMSIHVHVKFVDVSKDQFHAVSPSQWHFPRIV